MVMISFKGSTKLQSLPVVNYYLIVSNANTVVIDRKNGAEQWGKIDSYFARNCATGTDTASPHNFMAISWTSYRTLLLRSQGGCPRTNV